MKRLIECPTQLPKQPSYVHMNVGSLCRIARTVDADLRVCPCVPGRHYRSNPLPSGWREVDSTRAGDQHWCTVGHCTTMIGDEQGTKCNTGDGGENTNQVKVLLSCAAPFFQGAFSRALPTCYAQQLLLAPSLCRLSSDIRHSTCHTPREATGEVSRQRVAIALLPSIAPPFPIPSRHLRLNQPAAILVRFK